MTPEVMKSWTSAAKNSAYLYFLEVVFLGMPMIRKKLADSCNFPVLAILENIKPVHFCLLPLDGGSSWADDFVSIWS